MGLAKEEQFNQILSKGKIKSVYQPIVSLKDGEILGYEALSRIVGDDNQIQIAEMLGSTIYDFLKQKVGLSEVCIVDSENNVLGVLTKADLMEKFSGRFGYNIYAKKKCWGTCRQ